MGLGIFQESTQGSATVTGAIVQNVLSQFGRRYLVMKTRKRVTADGGASVLVLDF
jgi:hypothetical protein